MNIKFALKIENNQIIIIAQNRIWGAKNSNNNNMCKCWKQYERQCDSEWRPIPESVLQDWRASLRVFVKKKNAFDQIIGLLYGYGSPVRSFNEHSIESTVLCLRTQQFVVKYSTKQVIINLLLSLPHKAEESLVFN